jgi:preprotein translocase subunit SecG
MTIIFIILIILASVILGLIVLVQNPKGGGLAGNIAGFSNQFMGVKQTTDVLEKGTWIFAGIIGVLCLFSVFFISGKGKEKQIKPPEVTFPVGGTNTNK